MSLSETIVNTKSAVETSVAPVNDPHCAPADSERDLVLKKLFGLLYLIRVPILALASMVGLGVLANTIARQVLANLFDQGTSAAGVCAVCFFGFLLSAVCIVCVNNVINYGRVRCGDQALFGISNHSRKGILVGWIVFVAGAIPSFVFAGFVWNGTKQLTAAQKLGPTALALLFAVIAGLLAKGVQIILWDGAGSKLEEYPPDLVIPLYPLLHRYRFYESLAKWVPARGINNRLQPWMRWFQKRLGPGYIHDCHPPRLQINSGHLYVVGIYSITFLLWFLFGKCKEAVLQGKPVWGPVFFLSQLPPLAWVLVLLMVATMTLAGLSFYLDRYRFPLLSLLAILAFITNLTPKSDHFFGVQTSAQSDFHKYSSPGNILRSRIGRGTRRFVVVSTAGGGIQAAAWTAKVLDGLGKDSPAFRQSVLAISSVSGGSVGTLAYARTFDQTNPPTHDFDPVAKSEEGALDAAAWGWTVPDVWRALVPWTRSELVDRGWAIERAWTRIFELRPKDHELQLGDWAPETAKTMPALILNASVVETGHPVVFTNSSFADASVERGATASIYNFHTMYEHPPPYTYDVSMATATRLSSAFPFVAPAARPNLLSATTSDYHYVDGGYYDNFGITTLFAWLEMAIRDAKCEDCQFLLLRITHFPDPNTSPKDEHGWLFQLYAPLQGLYDARDAGQLAGDNNQVWLEAQLRPALTGTAIQFGSKDHRCSSPPLSWQLNDSQKHCIDDTWNSGSPGGSNVSLIKARRCVSDFVAGRGIAFCQKLAAEGLAPEEKRVPKPAQGSKVEKQ